MKNLKDYFTSPKSDDVKTEQDEEVVPSSRTLSAKRKPRVSLASKKSKKKKSCDFPEDSPVEVILKPKPNLSPSTPIIERRNRDQKTVKCYQRNSPFQVNSNKNKTSSNDLKPSDPVISITNETPKKQANLSQDVSHKQKLEEVSAPTNSCKERKKRKIKRRSLAKKQEDSAISGLCSINGTKDSTISLLEESQTSTNEITNVSDHSTSPLPNQPSTTIDKDKEVSTPDIPSDNRRSSLLSYFNKVDKSFEIKKEDIKTIKVEALVHEPRSSLPSPSYKTFNKVKKKKKSMDYDLIVLEEDTSICEPSAPWQIRISLQPHSPEEAIILEDESSGVDSIFEEAHPKVSTSLTIAETSKTTTPSLKEDETIVLDDNSDSISLILNPTNSKSSAVPRDLADSATSTPCLQKEVIILDDESVTDGRTIKSTNSESCATPTGETNSRTSTPSLKRVGGLAAYFGVKTETASVSSTASKKKTERNSATQIFLNSPAPACLAKFSRNPSSSGALNEGDSAPFPLWNHITQIDGSAKQSSSQNIRLTPPISPPPTPTSCVGLLTIFSSSPNNTSSHQPVPTQKQITSAKKLLIQQMKEEGLCGKTWIKTLKSMKNSCAGGVLWADRYRPTTTDHVLIGRAQVNALSSWLSHFDAASSVSDSDSESSGDEFVSDKDKTRSQGYDGGNTALLIGPPGVGKTAAVYAVAKCNGYQVLELNASCNRNGKRINQEFSEATQSHKVETKSHFKSKSKKKSNLNQPNKKSLILIEDSDILIGQVDEGYVSSLLALQSSSKRPLVLVANDPACRHMRRLVPSSSSALRLSFCRPSPLEMGYYLRGVSLVEGHVLEENICDLLVKSSGDDLRKALLELQFYSATCCNQLDKRKIDLLNYGSLSAFPSNLPPDEVVSSIRNAGLLCLVDMLAEKEECSLKVNENCLTEQISQDLVKDEIMRSDLSHYLTGMLYDFTSNSSYLEKGKLELEGSACLSEAVDEKQRITRRAMACDYLSVLRQLARAEQHRLHTQTKRNKRYFNYLHCLGIDTSNQDLLASSCSALTNLSPTENQSE